MWILLQLEPDTNFYYGQEMRVCFETIKINTETGAREYESAVFYGDVETMRFEVVGLPRKAPSEGNHEFWLCSQPRNSPDIYLY